MTEWQLTKAELESALAAVVRLLPAHSCLRKAYLLTYPHRWLGAHGLSLLVTTEVGNEKHTFIFDCGPESKSIDRNVKALEIDLTKVEAIALSVSSIYP